MIRSFTVTNHIGESLDLILAEPEKSGLAIINAEGLGQVDADVNLTDLADSDYTSVNSIRLQKRNVVFDILYYGDDIESCRHTCYRYFPVKKLITLVAKTDKRELMLTGFVEKNTPNIFSETSGCQVSILCPDPFWYSTEETVIPFGGIEPKFEFPFPEGITDSEGWDTFEVGNIRIIKEKSIYYTGEAEVGFTIDINATGTVRDLVFYDVNQMEQLSIDDEVLALITGGTSIKKGDRIIITTMRRQKKAILVREGSIYNIINALGRDRSWFELDAGDNLYAYSASEGEFELDINIKYRNLYKGL